MTEVQELGGTRRGRSPGMLILAVGLAIGAGVLASVLKPPSGPTQTASGGLSVPVDSEVATPDPEEARAALLEQLVAASRSEPRPSSLPAYEALALPCRRGMEACGPVLERLRQDDVPTALVTAFARELPRGAGEEFDALVRPLLAGDPERRDLAIDLYRKRKRAVVATDTGCRCGFGVVPTPLEGEAWLFADAPRGGLSWEPVGIEGGWRLQVRQDGDGPARLAMKVPVDGALRVEAAEGGAHVTVGAEEERDGDP